MRQKEKQIFEDVRLTECSRQFFSYRRLSLKMIQHPKQYSTVLQKAIKPYNLQEMTIPIASRFPFGITLWEIECCVIKFPSNTHNMKCFPVTKKIPRGAEKVFLFRLVRIYLRLCKLLRGFFFPSILNHLTPSYKFLISALCISFLKDTYGF